MLTLIPSGLPTAKPRVLYVDDETENLVSFKALFRRDYEIFLAQSAHEAMDILRAESMDVLVTDQRMPEMSGSDLLELAAAEFPHVARFMLTGYSDFDPLVQAINKGKVQGYFSKPIKPGEVAEQITKSLEVSRLKERNRQLLIDYEKSQALLRQAHALARIGIWSWDLTTNQAVWSEELRLILGWSPDAPTPKLSELPHVFSREDLEQLQAAIDAAALLGRDYELELQCRCPGDTVVWVKLFGGPTTDDGGRITGVHGTVQDITEVKRSQDELRRARDVAEDANRTKSEFLANMSHEIRTPLSGLLGMMHLLENSALSEEQQDFVRLAIQSGKRLTQLLSDILDLSRIEEGQMPVRNEAFKLPETIAALQELFAPLCREKKLSLVTDIFSGLPATLVGDEGRVRQVLFNIIGNALKFTDCGHVRIHVWELSTREPGKIRLGVSVTDTGAGISEDILPQLCKPFSQAAKSFTRQHQGAGLGLTISQRLVDSMHGALSIDSVLGEGTTVLIMLPMAVASESPRQAQDHRKQSAPRQGAMTILLVEDDDVCRISAQAILRSMGHRVETAVHGREAIDVLGRQRFDCVLMDVQMPVLDGVSATRMIREGRAGVLDPQVPIVAQTAYALAGDCDAFLQAGMNDYTAKPLSVQGLSEVLARVVHGRDVAAE